MMLEYMLARDSRYPLLPPEIWQHVAACLQRGWYVASPDEAECGWIEPSAKAARFRWRQRRLLHVTPDDSDFDDFEVADEEEDMTMEQELRRARNSTSAMSEVHAIAMDGRISPVPEMDSTCSSSSDQDGISMLLLDDLGSTTGSEIVSHWSRECEADLQEAACRVAWV
jgi:hypothetical protein